MRADVFVAGGKLVACGDRVGDKQRKILCRPQLGADGASALQWKYLSSPRHHFFSSLAMRSSSRARAARR